MLDSSHSALLLRVNVIEGSASLILILRRVDCQLVSTAHARAPMIIRGRVRVPASLQRLDYCSTRWNQIKITTLKLFLESLHLTFALLEIVID